MTDGNAPVIIGVGQLTWRDGDAPEPIDLLTLAARSAVDDSGVRDLARSLTSIRVVRMFSAPYRDPGVLLSARLGAPTNHTLYTGIGGHWPQALAGRAAVDLYDGLEGVVLIGGAETWRTRLRYRARGERMPWTEQSDPESRELNQPTNDGDVELMTEHELAAGISAPVHAYALIESARRASLGRPADEHDRAISELWSQLSVVAAGNPHAVVRDVVSSERIRTADGSNRYVSLPYTKLMTANNRVDQASAILMCTAATARRLGVTRDRCVFLHGASEAAEVPYLTQRASLARSPAIARGGRAALDAAAVTLDDVEYLDVYSCFPSAVQIAAAELGIAPARTVTVTGGLTFAGGPWNNYVTHALATMVDRLRRHPGAFGLCTANGGLLTKHAFGVYSTRPSSGRPVVVRTPAPDPQVPAAVAFEGAARIEAATVAFDRQGPTHGIVCAMTSDGRRTWARTSDPSLVEAMIDEDPTGRDAVVAQGHLRDFG